MSDHAQAQADPELEAALEQALDAYREVLPGPELAALTELLREELARHPVSARLLRQLAPPPVVTRSADVVSSPGAAETPLEEARRRRTRR